MREESTSAAVAFYGRLRKHFRRVVYTLPDTIDVYDQDALPSLKTTTWFSFGYRGVCGNVHYV